MTQPDAPVPYRKRTRDYYRALGFDAPYRWAHHADVPFARLEKPLATCRVALVTTAAPYQPGSGDQGPGAPYNAAAKFFRVYSDDAAGTPDPRISHLGYDRAHTTADDVNSYFPLARLKTMAAAGRIGGLAPRFHGAPTNRSQEVTRAQDAPEVLKRVREDRADAAVLVAT
jgi:hypothetical protein